MPHPPAPPTDALGRSRTLERIVGAIEVSGYAAEPHFAPLALTTRLSARAQALDARGELRQAGVGRGDTRNVATAVRGDRIRWLDARAADRAEREALDAFEALRLALNRRLTLGLFELELHYAIYPPGARYAPHRDRFRDDDARVVSCVLYLNDGWGAVEGGALRLHLDDGATLDVLPHAGTLVAFLSERFVHEVMPATRDRLSLTGWFRRRA